MRGSVLPRRTVLAAGLSVASTGGAAWRAPGDECTRVVLVLRGGADGLSLIVPYQDASYYRARRTTAVTAATHSKMADLVLDEQFALHPGLAPLKAMFLEGELAIGVAVGPREIHRSHPTASATLHRTLQARFGALPAGDAPCRDRHSDADGR